MTDRKHNKKYNNNNKNTQIKTNIIEICRRHNPFHLAASQHYSSKTLSFLVHTHKYIIFFFFVVVFKSFYKKYFIILLLLLFLAKRRKKEIFHLFVKTRHFMDGWTPDSRIKFQYIIYIKYIIYFFERQKEIASNVLFQG